QTKAAAGGYLGGVEPSCTQVGTPGRDKLTGDAGPNVLCGMGGNDTLKGGGGDDALFGGAGTDRAVYAGAPGAVHADLLHGTATGDGADLLASMESLVGSSHDDLLRGSNGNNTLSGGA